MTESIMHFYKCQEGKINICHKQVVLIKVTSCYKQIIQRENAFILILTFVICIKNNIYFCFKQVPQLHLLFSFPL